MKHVLPWLAGWLALSEGDIRRIVQDKKSLLDWPLRRNETGQNGGGDSAKPHPLGCLGVVQFGKKYFEGSSRDIEFVLEPEILGEARLGYETVLNPELLLPRLGVDESGKGDFFGPLCVAGVYVNASVVQAWGDAGVRAWVGLAATYSPNAYVVGFDTDGETALVHDLVRNRSSESPV